MATKNTDRKQLMVNPDDQEFMDEMRKLHESGAVEWANGEETFEIEHFTEPTQFEWHQRIFDPGMILHKVGTNVRIYLSDEQLNG